MREFIEMSKTVTRKGWNELTDYLATQHFAFAPASTMHHSANRGGLIAHSVAVTNIMLTMNKALDAGIPEESIIIAGLLHDCGKAGCYNEPYYSVNRTASGELSKAKPYQINPHLLNFTHEVLSLMIAEKFIQLTQDEAFAILYHNGLYVQTGHNIRGSERPLQLILHWADMYEARFTSRKQKEIVGGLF